MHDTMEIVNARTHAVLNPRKRKCAVIMSVKPINITKRFVASMEEIGIYSFKSLTRDAMGGVRTEIILITPNKKIITGGNKRRNNSFPFNAKEIMPAARGSQNSNILKRKVIANAPTGKK